MALLVVVAVEETAVARDQPHLLYLTVRQAQLIPAGVVAVALALTHQGQVLPGAPAEMEHPELF
jgi:hypothetical protein